LVCPERVE